MRSFLAIAAFSALLTAASASAEPFRIIVTSREAPLVPNSVLYLAQSEGYFKRAGVDVELVPVEQTPSAITALRTGGGELANISVDGLLGLYIGGLSDLKAVGSTDKSIPFVIVGRSDLTLDRLAGVKFGIGRPNSLDYSLSYSVLETLRASPQTMSFVPLGQPSVRAQALVQGRVDATTMSIGEFMAIPDRTGLKVLVDNTQYFAAVPIVSKVNVASKEVITNRSKDLDAVLEALTLAARDYAADGKAWAEAMSKLRPDVERPILDALAPLYASNWSANGGLQRKELDATQYWLYLKEKYAGSDVVIPGVWADFAPIDRVLTKIGISRSGDAVSRAADN